MVFYRKYRPQTLSDVIGQDTVKKALFSAFANNKLSHAYLFCGPRGTGKTSTARILAKMVNCESPKEGDPCNLCSSCLTISDGSNMDLVEIDAASNRGIDDIRALRETIKLAPTAASKKVYIIDEVHMLSNEAFNALLKTLEEPPSHAVFILATTEAQKIPVTILSRVQRLDFKLASNEEMTQALKKIAEAEGIAIDPDALNLIVKRAAGSFRDGTKLLDQLAASGEPITAQVVETGLGRSDFAALLEILNQVHQRSPEQVLELVQKQLEKGISAKEIIMSLMELGRQAMLVSSGVGEKLVKPELREEQYKALEKLAKNLGTQRIVGLLDCLQKSYDQVRFASIASLPLEVALLECCLEGTQPQHVSVVQVPVAVPIATPAPIIRSAGKSTSFETTVVIDDQPKTEIGPSNSEDLRKIEDRWTYILETIKQYNYSLEALLRSSKIAECNDAHVIFEVPYSFHQRILEAPKSRDMLESVLSDVLSRSVRVSTVLGQQPLERDELANVEVAEEDETIRMVAEIFSAEAAT